MAADDLSHLDTLVRRLVEVSWRERDAVKAELLAAAQAMADRDAVTRRLTDAARDISDLEVRWELDEVLEALAPPKVEEPEEEEEPKGDSASDFAVVYDDPRGLQLYKHKDGTRWIANQVDPRTGQPASFEISLDEVTQLKARLQGSPYWVIGSGEGLVT